MTWESARLDITLALQRELKRRGLYRGKIDGMPGPKTWQAFRDHFELGLPEFACPLRNFEGREWQVTNGYDPVKHKGWDLFLDYLIGDEPAEGHAYFVRGKPRWWYPENTMAVAVANGVVVHASDISTGGLVIIDHGFGILSMYFHAYKYYVSKGQRVKRGQDLILCGHDLRWPLSARNPVHLHFAMKRDGKYIDPADLMVDAIRLD